MKVPNARLISPFSPTILFVLIFPPSIIVVVPSGAVIIYWFVKASIALSVKITSVLELSPSTNHVNLSAVCSATVLTDDTEDSTSSGAGVHELSVNPSTKEPS